VAVSVGGFDPVSSPNGRAICTGSSGAATEDCSTAGAASADSTDSTSGRTSESIISDAGTLGPSSVTTGALFSCAGFPLPEVLPFEETRTTGAGAKGEAFDSAWMVWIKATTASVVVSAFCSVAAADATTVPAAFAQAGHSRILGEHSRPHSGQIQYSMYPL
jgi:hypothetical protein